MGQGGPVRVQGQLPAVVVEADPHSRTAAEFAEVAAPSVMVVLATKQQNNR